jgi:hypothetical protein
MVTSLQGFSIRRWAAQGFPLLKVSGVYLKYWKISDFPILKNQSCKILAIASCVLIEDNHYEFCGAIRQRLSTYCMKQSIHQKLETLYTRNHPSPIPWFYPHWSGVVNPKHRSLILMVE